MTREDAETFAHDWAVAWNDLAIERVLAHFDEKVSFSSPTALAVVGVATVRGKPALREYWTRALSRITELHFTVERILWDASTDELAIIYESEINGQKKRVSENLMFGEHGLVVKADVFHGAGA